MNKKLSLIIIGLLIVIGGITAMSAFEAHVINVTAHIENALKVHPLTGELTFGTVFPQEYQTRTISVTTSESFCKPDQRRVLSIDYKIVQKPKCWNNNPADPKYAPLDYATEKCPKIGEVQYVEMPSLCPFLSKTPKITDPSPYTDHGVLAFHDPKDPASVATGTINKDEDLSDDWIIDLPTPCFKGMCSQDWDEFVHKYNPSANPDDYILPANLEGKDFGCDLWVEVTNIY